MVLLNTQSPLTINLDTRSQFDSIPISLQGSGQPVTNFAQGIAAGDITDDSAVLWTRTENSDQQGIATPLIAEVSSDPQFTTGVRTFEGNTDEGRDYTLKLDISGLDSLTPYYYRFRTQDYDYSSVGSFKTAPTADQEVGVRFGFSGDADGKWRPYPSLSSLKDKNLDYFVFLGDTIYETKSNISEATTDPFANPAQALADYHRKYRENLEPVIEGGFPGTQDIYSSQGNYILIDNHELGNKQFINGGAPAGTPAGIGVDATDTTYDVNRTGTYINETEGFKALLQAYNDYQPIREKIISAPDDPRTDGTQQLYYAQQWGDNSIFINVDDRSYRDIRLKTPAGADDLGSRADNPERTMLGATQLNWLKQTLLDAKANNTTWKFIAISSPIDETDNDSGKSWPGNYRAERNDLLKFIADNQIDNVVFLSTDDHLNRVNELTYLTDPSDPSTRTRVPNTFTIVAGPIGAGGPDAITDHSFSNIQKLADDIVAKETAKGLDPLGLDPNNPNLHNVFREFDSDADSLRRPVAFYSPDTFNYVTLEVSPDGKTLSVNTYGINSYAADTYPEPSPDNPSRRILGFDVNAATPYISEPQVQVPKVILISLDGATPRLINQYLADGTLSPDKGLGLLASQGLVAEQNLTVTPSLTAPGHIAIATGSTAANNDINANTFHLVASPFNQNISGFAAPIGGYTVGIDGPSESSEPTAQPIWQALRSNGKKVVAATFPGADGADITVPGLSNSPIIQPASERTVDYTVPFGAFAGVGAKGFDLTASDFETAPQTIIDQIVGAGKVSYSPILETKNYVEEFKVGGVNYAIDVAALDTTDDSQVDYDTLVFFDANQGIQPGPFHLPSTGPAYVRASDQKSSPFYLEGSSNKAGTAFYVTNLAPDLSTVRFARYSANYIPRNPAVIADVDDINNNVGFWAPQSDFRITERLSPGFENFSDIELEAIYEDQVRNFVDYQTRVGQRAIQKNPDADLVMLYIEQPDGSEHQFLITDPRQATDPRDPYSIGENQDTAKIARYQDYVKTAYQVADRAVQNIIDTVGTDSQGRPNSNIIVVSDHGFDPFWTSIDINNYLRQKGFDSNKVRAVTSGPAVNVYFNLQGREPNGTVSREEYITLQQQVNDALKSLVDDNPNYTDGNLPVFDKIYTRPVPEDINDPSFGLNTSDFIGQDTGDVFALLTEGYNFDGIQTPLVPRLGDTTFETSVFSIPNFYGAHGYDPTLTNMSAIFYAAGPNIPQGTLEQVRDIDIAPTILQLLNVEAPATVQGEAIVK